MSGIGGESVFRLIVDSDGDQIPQERSSIGRAPVSKTGGCEFDSRRSCCFTTSLIATINSSWA